MQSELKNRITSATVNVYYTSSDDWEQGRPKTAAIRFYSRLDLVATTELSVDDVFDVALDFSTDEERVSLGWRK